MGKIKRTRADVIFNAVNNTFLIICLIVVLYPLIYIVSASFSSPQAVTSGKVWLFPVDFSLAGYKAVFENDYILTGYGNTIIYTVVGTAVNLVMTVLAAYPLSRKDFYGRDAFMFLFAFTMIFNGGLIPTYLLVSQLGLINTRWALIIPGAISVWNVIITRTYYQNTIPDELLEAAQLDGCSDIQFIWSVVLPLSKAITAVLVLFYGVGHWNEFFNAFIYLSKKELYPLQIVLRDILIMNSIDPNMVADTELMVAKQGLADLLKYSLIVVASVPVLCIYPFVQKYFVKGVMIGAIKG
ncbi:carbohydrate ABC transporter permease [Mahella australiensis]|uniref:Carbohydrate ABC transporter membrane protein 2, CUT1 family n=1 Tax=Mahella australiensis (strain DSM 15567 / CIP 107919 / 50-1 BON) TaxID=697281 RepID=F4A0V8_MAHA5|nr:carbohydrate ABC transporter permease [Mahella australiensis]AEE97004.1 carbohydrate ABC transporter membrane protein 2, CUT1 family [Mahella australiensis 50-1 BON]